MGIYKGGGLIYGGGPYTWMIFCVSNKQVRHKQVSHKQENKHVLRWLPRVLIVQHTIVLKKTLFYHLAKYDHETRPYNCYNIANYEK